MKFRFILLLVFLLNLCCFGGNEEKELTADQLAGDRTQIPLNVQISQGDIAGKVKINWDIVPGAETYLIYKSDSLSSPLACVNKTTSCSFEDIDVTAGFNYWYCIQAYSAEKGYSNITSRVSGYSTLDNDNWGRISVYSEWSGRGMSGVLIFNNKIWIIGGYNGAFDEANIANDGHFPAGSFCNDVWSSDDGMNWSLVTDSPLWADRSMGTGGAAVVFNGYMYVIGGRQYDLAYNNEVWRSEDGINWSRMNSPRVWNGTEWIDQKFTARAGHRAVIHAGKLYVFGGYDGVSYLNDIWYTEDGSQWTKVTQVSPIPTGRIMSGFVSYNNELWVIGGFKQNGIVTDEVWHSADGASWLSASPVPSPRTAVSALSYDGYIYLIGGDQDAAGTYFNEVLIFDGNTWSLKPTRSEFLPRSHSGAAVFNNRLYIFGGMTANRYLSDIWYRQAGQL